MDIPLYQTRRVAGEVAFGVPVQLLGPVVGEMVVILKVVREELALQRVKHLFSVALEAVHIKLVEEGHSTVVAVVAVEMTVLAGREMGVTLSMAVAVAVAVLTQVQVVLGVPAISVA